MKNEISKTTSTKSATHRLFPVSDTTSLTYRKQMEKQKIASSKRKHKKKFLIMMNHHDYVENIREQGYEVVCRH